MSEIEKILEKIPDIPDDIIFQDHGLQNLGNTCYLNSVLQMLFHIPQFKNFFSHSDKVKQILLENREYKNIMVSVKFYELFVSYWTRNKKVILQDLKYFKKVFGEHFRDQFYGYRQNDQHECLTHLINTLHESLGRKANTEVSIDATKLEKESFKAYKEQTLSGWRVGSKWSWPSIISDLFSGQTHNRTECVNCGYVSHIFESFKVFTAPIPINDKLETKNCLDYATSINQLSESNQYKCDKCNKKNQSLKRLTIWRRPQVLLLNICRFIHTYNQRFPIVKDNRNIIGTTKLDILSNCSSKTTRNIYSLFAVCIHHGGVNGGHCISRVKQDTKWQLYDDSTITDSDKDHGDGYIYCYQLKK